jgi:hypothetical protein
VVILFLILLQNNSNQETIAAGTTVRLRMVRVIADSSRLTARWSRRHFRSSAIFIRSLGDALTQTKENRRTT